MRYVPPQWIITLLLGFALPLAACETDRVSKYEAQLRTIWGQDMKDEFDAGALRTLADKPSLSRSDQAEMLAMILHAAVKKDGSFEDFLERPDL